MIDPESLLFEIKALPAAVDVASFADSFARLQTDHYIEGTYRSRALSRFRGPADALIHLPHGDFMQSAYVNQLLGNIQRNYPEIEEAVIASDSFKALIKSIQDFYQFDPDTTILGVHQIRITCSLDEQGEPAPEGIHQDGFDFISITCMAREQVAGAHTEFYPSPDAEALFSDVLQPGQIAYCNDRRIFHYTTPIHPAAGQKSGHRDVFVITARTGVSA